jgi:poly(3-hydroxybutyrate) depolymerase
MKPTFGLWGLVLFVCPALTLAQSGKPAVVIFKDGFHVKGNVIQEKEIIIDPITGVGISIAALGKPMYMDDGARRILFPIPQVQEVLELKPEQIKEQVKIFLKVPTPGGGPLLPGWEFESISDWDPGTCGRTFKVKTPTGRLNMEQRFSLINAYCMLGVTVGYAWEFGFLTQEFDPKLVRAMVERYLIEKTPIKEPERRLKVATFLRQAGWYDMADRELQTLAEKFPDQEEAVKRYRAELLTQKCDLLAEGVERMFRVGQHERAQGYLEEFTKDEEMAKALSDKWRLPMQDLKSKYAALLAQLPQAQQFLKDFPKYTANRTVWSAACKMIDEELHIDSIGRLKTFLELAPQHAKELKEGKKPTQKTEEILALAVSGWLQGDGAAVTDANFAITLYRTREFVLNYLRTDSPTSRNELLASFVKRNDVPADVLVRLIRQLPPTHAYDKKLDATEPTKVSIDNDLPKSDGGSYYLQLPPEYNPQRSYPVAILLQSQREKADVLVKRWQFEAAKHGFILVAPLWGGTGLQPKYRYTKDEQAIVLDTLRDVRRRFNVDSDRVFLFGWQQGANAAFDIGLAHPDQFAGISPMNGDVSGFPYKYWSNAQFLPMYIVEGDRNGYAKSTRVVLKDWLRGQYPVLYLEYKGRSSEWYSAEVPHIMDWMSRKKRVHPIKQMGSYHTGGVAGGGEEFKTMRACDNRFYWLSTDEILENHINTYTSWSQQTKPATLQASFAVANEASKSGAKIISHFNIRTSGIKQVSLWIAPNQIDFANQVLIRINGQQIGSYRTVQPSLATLLEELYLSGDRQRVFLAKLDFRL